MDLCKTLDNLFGAFNLTNLPIWKVCLVLSLLFALASCIEMKNYGWNPLSSWDTEQCLNDKYAAFSPCSPPIFDTTLITNSTQSMKKKA